MEVEVDVDDFPCMQEDLIEEPKFRDETVKLLRKPSIFLQRNIAGRGRGEPDWLWKGELCSESTLTFFDGDRD